MSTQESINKRLQELGNSDYEIVSGQPDIRGWNVVDSSERKIGEIDELIFDMVSNKVRYVVLDMEDNAFHLKSKNVLIPIGLLELHTNDDDVILNNVTIEQLQTLPPYDKNDLDKDMENRIHNVFSEMEGPMDTASSDDKTDFYSHEHFENNLNRNRPNVTPYEEHVRMRREPSFLESEGSNRLEIDDDIDNLEKDTVSIEERDAIPVTDNPALRSGNDIDEWDATDDNRPSRINATTERKDPDTNDRRNQSSEL